MELKPRSRARDAEAMGRQTCAAPNVRATPSGLKALGRIRAAAKDRRRMMLLRHTLRGHPFLETSMDSLRSPPRLFILVNRKLYLLRRKQPETQWH